MCSLTLEDTKVELSTRSHSFLDNVAHLILEIKLDDRLIGEIDLVSCESNPGVWKADQVFFLPETSSKFMLSVLMEVDGDELRLLGSAEMNEPTFYHDSEKVYEIPLFPDDNYPKLIVKSRVLIDEIVEESISPQSASPEWLSSLEKIHEEALAAYNDFLRTENVESLEQAIVKFLRASAMIPEGDSGLSGILSNLGVCLLHRFERLGNVADLEDSIARHRTAVALTPKGNPAEPGRLNNLGLSLLRSFERFGKIADIDDAIASKQAAVDLTPNSDPDKPMYLSNLGASFESRFQRLGNLADMNDAIRSKQAAVDLTPNGHPDKPGRLNNLGISLRTRFERLGNLADIDAAITSNQAAVDLTSDSHPKKRTFLTNLGNSLMRRFKRLGNLPDIDNAITSHKEAVRLTPDSYTVKSIYLSNLGSSLGSRFERLGDLADINHSIIAKQAAIEFVPDTHPSKPGLLSNLGNSFHSRFLRLGKIADIDDAIINNQKAVDLTADGHPEKPMYLGNLGGSFETRFHRLGILTDIDNAIVSNQAAVHLSPPGHPYKPASHSNLGSSLEARFELLGDPLDINNAISSKQIAVDLTPADHPEKSKYLNSLGNSLMTRFQRLQTLADIDNAILANEAAVNLMPSDHPRRIHCLNSLGNSFRVRYQRFGDLADINNAITSNQVAVDLTPVGHPDRPLHLGPLGQALWLRYRHLGHREDAEASISASSEAANSDIGPPVYLFKAAKTWIAVAAISGHSSLLTAYERALSIMPLVAWLGLPIVDRHRHLAEMGGMTRDAAGAAISAGLYDKALEWLEQGRSIVWTQVLHLRTPVDDLRDIDSGLSERLVQVSRLLDQGSEQGSFSNESGRQYRALAAEWESLVEQVRSLPSSGNYLKPRSSNQLLKATHGGTVVVLNTAKQRCDALALVPGSDNVIHIPLPNVTFKRVTELAEELKDLLSSSGIRMRGKRAAQKVEDESDEDDCKQILAELWNNLVKPVLNALAFPLNPDTPPRIWWCATGSLAFLPIHAAGIYDSGSSADQLSNYAISSYVPTVSTLLEQPHPDMGSTFKLLSVIQSSAPGASSIPNTKEELACLRRRLVNRDIIVLEGSEGTKGRVIAEMRGCSWLHLACHGMQRPEEPTKSALLLQDGPLTLEEIIRLNLPNAQFAFLSACQTTTGDMELSEEAVHIAGGMLLAGYRGVVATMWSIQDDLAPEVTDEFYAHIIRDVQQPDSRRAAEALHVAVQKLRQKRNIPLTAWVPFVHLGI